MYVCVFHCLLIFDMVGRLNLILIRIASRLSRFVQYHFLVSILVSLLHVCCLGLFLLSFVRFLLVFV